MGPKRFARVAKGDLSPAAAAAETAASRKQCGEGKPETFDFLGFTRIGGQSRKNGKFLVLRKTVRKRLLAKLKELKEELRRRWQQPVAELGRWLRSVVQRGFNYHVVPGNIASLRSFRLEVIRRWLRALRRRASRPVAQPDRAQSLPRHFLVGAAGRGALHFPIDNFTERVYVKRHLENQVGLLVPGADGKVVRSLRLTVKITGLNRKESFGPPATLKPRVNSDPKP